ncbi:UNVERIFIED_CONTAM: hypothetical protein FKN15_037548 [Acipenser sinensis]
METVKRGWLPRQKKAATYVIHSDKEQKETDAATREKVNSSPMQNDLDHKHNPRNKDNISTDASEGNQCNSCISSKGLSFEGFPFKGTTDICKAFNKEKVGLLENSLPAPIGGYLQDLQGNRTALSLFQPDRIHSDNPHRKECAAPCMSPSLPAEQPRTIGILRTSRENVCRTNSAHTESKADLSKMRPGFSSITIAARRVATPASTPPETTPDSCLKHTEGALPLNAVDPVVTVDGPSIGRHCKPVLRNRKAKIIKVTEYRHRYSYTESGRKARVPEYRHSYTEGENKENAYSHLCEEGDRRGSSASSSQGLVRSSTHYKVPAESANAVLHLDKSLSFSIHKPERSTVPQVHRSALSLYLNSSSPKETLDGGSGKTNENYLPGPKPTGNSSRVSDNTEMNQETSTVPPLNQNGLTPQKHSCVDGIWGIASQSRAAALTKGALCVLAPQIDKREHQFNYETSKHRNNFRILHLDDGQDDIKSLGKVSDCEKEDIRQQSTPSMITEHTRNPGKPNQCVQSETHTDLEDGSLTALTLRSYPAVVKLLIEAEGEQLVLALEKNKFNQVLIITTVTGCSPLEAYYVSIATENFQTPDACVLTFVIVRFVFSRGLFASHYTETHYLDDGSAVTVTRNSTVHCYYHGKVQWHARSEVSLSTCSGLRGFISLENKTYITEPAKGATNGTHFIYRAENLNGSPGTCGHGFNISGITLDSTAKSFDVFNMRHKRDTQRTTKYVELIIIADNREFQRQGKDVEKVKQRLIEVANYVDKFYRPLNIRVALVGLEVWSDTDKCSITQDPFTTLHEFLDWRKLKLLPQKPHDNAQLVSGVYFQGTTIGMAPIMSMCTAEQSGGIVMDHSENPLGAAVTLAHELGHNFGMNHDTPERGCNCRVSPDKGGCIMTPSTGYPFPTVFSSCSKKDLDVSLEKGVGMCLFNMPEAKVLYGGQKCGNGYVEEAEECDCGDIELKPAGTPCRDSSNACDLPEFCTGDGPHCPPNVYLHDGHSCLKVEGYCYNGICQTHEQQCITLWGQGAKPAPGICFERVNSAGDPYGNCGKNSKGSFAKCEIRDAECGKIQCQGGANRPVIGTNAVSIETNIPLQEGGRILCRGTHVYLGDDMPDPGLVLTGTKCGDGMMCLNRQCKNVSVFGIHECVGKCNGHGVCNNNKHCHCEADWSPPHCEIPGFGGSLDSGPMRLADNTSLTVGILVTLISLIIAGFIVCFKKKTLIRLLFTNKKTTIEKLSKLQAYYGNAPLPRVDNKCQTEVVYSNSNHKDHFYAAVRLVFEMHHTKEDGNIVVFLASSQEIDSAHNIIRQEAFNLSPDLGILVPVSLIPGKGGFVSRHSEEQERSSKPCVRRVFLTTSKGGDRLWAIDNVNFIIDVGVEKRNEIDSAHNIIRQEAFNLSLDLGILVPVSLIPGKGGFVSRHNEEQERSSKPCVRRVFLTTSKGGDRLWAIDNVNFIIDVGVEKRNVYNPRIRANSLVVRTISKSQAEIRCCKIFLTDIKEMRVIVLPDPESLMQSLEELDYLAALDDDGNLSEIGIIMSEFPLDPQMAKTLLASCEFDCVNEMLTIAAMLTAPNCFLEPPPGSEQLALTCHMKFQHSEGDHFILINVYNAY